MSKLSARTSAPRVQIAILKDGDCVCLSAGDLPDLLLFEYDDEFGLGLVGAAVFVLGHGGRVRVAQLPATPASPRVEAPLRRQSHRVRVSTGDLDYSDVHQKLHHSRSRLVRIALHIRRQIFHGCEPELSACTSAPRVYIALDINRDCVAITAGHLVNPLVAQLVDL